MSLARSKNLCSIDEERSKGEFLKNNMAAQFKLCSFCQTPMKKQMLGSNVVYYCKHCGCTTSTWILLL